MSGHSTLYGVQYRSYRTARCCSRPVDPEIHRRRGGVAVRVNPLTHDLPLQDTAARVDACVAEELDVPEHLPDVASVSEPDEPAADVLSGGVKEPVSVLVLHHRVGEQERESVGAVHCSDTLRGHPRGDAAGEHDDLLSHRLAPRQERLC